ncbi:MAG: GTP cyclohydrolase MptA [Candidatus Thorarchaeota archaeon]
MPARDVHKDKPDVQVSVRRVGVTGIRVPIQFIFFEEQPAIVVPTFDVYVDLPAYQKGIHPSRSYEATVEIVSKHAEKLHRLEDLCVDIAQEQLLRHDYATEAEVHAAADVVYARTTPKTAIRTYESCTMKAKAIAIRSAKKQIQFRKWIGVTVSGITACPCAQEMLRDGVESELTKEHRFDSTQAKQLVKNLPIGSHMQRSFGSIMVEIPPKFQVDALQLVGIVEDAMSASSFELLKRPDEVSVVQTALENPKFVEDAIRQLVKNVVEAFPTLPDEMELAFEQRNEECIHRHDLVAQQVITMGEARRQISENGNNSF